MKRFLLFIIIFGFVALCSAAAYAYFFYIPKIVEQKIIGSFNQFGFEDLTFKSLKHKSGQIILSDISLDSNRFSTIDELNIRFSLTKFIMNPDRAQEIFVKGLNLTGELSEGIIPTISGWQNNQKLLQSLQGFPAGKIIIRSATLDLLSKKFGGIKIRGNAKIDIQPSGEITIKARTTSTQKRLSFQSKIDASISSEKDLSFMMTMDDVSVDLPNTVIKRGHGELTGSYPLRADSTQILSLDGAIQLASMRWYNMPLGKINAKIEYNEKYRKFNLEGITFGPEKIQWQTTASHSLEDNINHSTTQITPNNLAEILEFLERNKSLSLNTEIPAPLLIIKNPRISIDNIINSKLETNGSVVVSFKKPKTSIKAQYSLEPGSKDIIGSVKLEKATFRPSSKKPDGTFFNLSGSGEFTIKHFENIPKLLWIGHTNIHTGALDFDALKIPNVKGFILLSDISNGEKTKEHYLNFKFPLKKNINHKGLISLNLNDPNNPLLDKLIVHIYGGTIKTQNPIVNSKGVINKKNSLNVANINLTSLIRDAGFSDVSITGALAGIIPIELNKAGIHANGALLQSQNSGIIKLPKNMINGLFPGNSPQIKELQVALENYHYEYFEIRFDGNLNDRVMMTLNAQGTNPYSKNKKPINVNLQIETQISLLFNSLLK